ncbi:MAG: carotenoid biosynthesis protein [Alkalicoccus sp.]|nr:MAG: carotenoid biosynthesis protein [Alkalicoccus sp.]
MPAAFDLYLYRFFIVWYVIGVVLLSFHLVPPWLEWANVVFLITSGLLAIMFFYRSTSKIIGIFIVLSIFFVSMFMESFGVHTGLFFGNYSYETDFGPKLAGVPVTIGFAWIMVIATSHVLAAPLLNKLHVLGRTLYALYGALIATSLDLILDPFAYEVKQYWVWHDGGLYYDIPFTNFAGWFVLSFVLHLFISVLLYRKGKWQNNRSFFWQKRMLYLYGMMAGMFIIVSAVNGLVLAPVLSILTMAVYYTVYRLLKREVQVI